MSESTKFRFPDLERNKANPSQQPKKVKTPVPKQETLPHQNGEGITRRDIQDLEKQLDQFVERLDRSTFVPTYPSNRYENIEYYVVDQHVLVHNYQTDTYIFGGQKFEDMDYRAMKKFIQENYSAYWMTGKMEADKPYIDEFCEIYTKEIVGMIHNLASAQVSVWGDGKCITEDILNVVQEYYDKFSPKEEADEEEEETSEDSSPEEDEEDSEETETVTDIQRQVEQEDAEAMPEEIPELDLGYPDTSNTNLGKYASKINEAISDEDVRQMIREARQKKADRSIQLRYTSN